MQTSAARMRHWKAPAQRSPDFFTYNPMNSSDETNGWWNNAYQDINTLNGVLFYAKSATPDTIVNQCVAQAHFPSRLLVLYAGDQFR